MQKMNNIRTKDNIFWFSTLLREGIQLAADLNISTTVHLWYELTLRMSYASYTMWIDTPNELCPLYCSSEKRMTWCHNCYSTFYNLYNCAAVVCLRLESITISLCQVTSLTISSPVVGLLPLTSGLWLGHQKKWRNFRRIPCYIFRRKTLCIQTQLVLTRSSNGRL
jgi:hypothetical protein